MLTTVLSVMVLALGAAVLIIQIRLKRARKHLDQLKKTVLHLEREHDILKAQAHYDFLTGLANRSLLTDRFRVAIERSKRSQMPFAVVMIDLNSFKAINDQHGHAAGDQVLIAVGRRLLDTVRASDTVARVGGDEFVLVIESIPERHELGTIGQKLIDVLSQKVVLDSGETVSVGASIGFALFPADGLNMDDLLHVADHAMYECKTSGLMPLF